MNDIGSSLSYVPRASAAGSPLERRALIIEDDLVTRTLLENVLLEMGFVVEAFHDGVSAWNRLQAPNPPYFLILDWMMPGMDGLELTKRVMSLKSKRSFYVIMVTAMNGVDNITAALEAGASDYVVKPFCVQELRARVNVAMRVLGAQDDLLSYGCALKELAEERARQLVQADKMATIGTLAAGIAHEINNPTTFIAGNITVLEECIDLITQVFTPEMQAAMSKRTRFALSRLPIALSSIRNGVERITSISSGLKTYSRKSDIQAFRPVDIEACVDQALSLCHNRLKYQVTVQRTRGARPRPVHADEQQVVQVVVNLLLNAADALEGVREARVSIATHYGARSSRLTIRDNGPGISGDLVDRIFDPFFTTKEVGKGTGLGLSISRNIAAFHQGSLEVAPWDGGGAAFTLTLPAKGDHGAGSAVTT